MIDDCIAYIDAQPQERRVVTAFDPASPQDVQQSVDFQNSGFVALILYRNPNRLRLGFWLRLPDGGRPDEVARYLAAIPADYQPGEAMVDLIVRLSANGRFAPHLHDPGENYPETGFFYDILEVAGHVQVVIAPISNGCRDQPIFDGEAAEVVAWAEKSRVYFGMKGHVIRLVDAAGIHIVCVDRVRMLNGQFVIEGRDVKRPVDDQQSIYYSRSVKELTVVDV